MTLPPSPVLSGAQLATLAHVGVERTAPVGQVLFQAGDRRYPFIAIIEGEAMIQDDAGRELMRHRESGFIGEINLLAVGQFRPDSEGPRHLASRRVSHLDPAR